MQEGLDGALQPPRGKPHLSYVPAPLKNRMLMEEL